MQARDFERAVQRPWWLALLLAVLMALLSACSDSPSPAPTISVQPSDTSAVAGSAATLSVSASGPDISYQWQQSTDGGTTWTNVAGATLASYTTPVTTLADSGKRYRVVVSAAGISVNSSAVTLTVTAAVQPASITVQPAAASVTAPGNAVFSITATGSALQYQWQRSTDGGATWSSIAGAVAASHDAGATDVSMNGHQYRVLVSNSLASVTSAAATLTVNPAPAAPAFSTQPAGQAITAGSAAAFTVAATGTPTPTLQWQRSTDGGSTWANIAGATDATFNTGAATLTQNGERYRALASNASGTATSNVALLTVDPAPAAPAITQQPAAQTVTAPAAATFSAAATGVPTPTWQWQLSTDGGTSFANINGATAASYTTPATATTDSGKRYRAIATNASGNSTTNAVTLTVNAPVVAIAYEGFDYPVGERLSGQNGGSGWSGAWSITDGSGGPLGAEFSGQIASGLRYADTAGNDLVTSGGAWQTSADVFFGQARRATAASLPGTAGSTLWMSFLVKQAATTAGVNYAGATPGTGYTFGSAAGLAGITSSPVNAFVACFYCSSGTASPIAGFGAGSVAMVLVRIDFAASGANDTMSVWINPPLVAGTALGTPTATAAPANFADALNGLTLVWGDARSFTFDELRLATERAAATPFTPAATGAGSTVFSSDFSSGMPAQINPGTATITGSQGFAGLGPTGNTFGANLLRSETGNVVTLTLTNLPAHQWLSLDFLFAAIDSLDGGGAYPSGDYLRVTIDGVNVFRESFANALASQVQTYVPPPSVQLARMVDLGFSGPGSFFTDSAYWLGGDPIFRRIPHSASSVTITMRIEGAGIQDLDDESWGMANLRVIVGP